MVPLAFAAQKVLKEAEHVESLGTRMRLSIRTLDASDIQVQH